MNDGLTWQEAKATAQKTELEIARLLPEDDVISIEQNPTGTLISCPGEQYDWNGATTVTLAPSADIDQALETMTRFPEERFEVSRRKDIIGELRIQLSSPTNGELYLVGHGFEPNQIRIASASACFTLPEGVYPGGDF